MDGETRFVKIKFVTYNVKKVNFYFDGQFGKTVCIFIKIKNILTRVNLGQRSQCECLYG